MLYPLKFHPIFKDKIWGGEKIKSILKKDFSPLPNCGESWEISGIKNNVSVVNDGKLEGKDLSYLIHKYTSRLLGTYVYSKFGADFPLLIKFIDANEDLSIQVHPNDELAWERHHSLGKTEMWYILQADEHAELIAGFNREMNRDVYLEHLKRGSLMEVLNKESAKKGDVFYMPAGRIHTIGKGLLLAEIQQSSDVTYRIYDFDRVDQSGNKRELHTQEALDAIDYNFYPEYKSKYEENNDTAVEIVKSPYFTTNKLKLSKDYQRDIEPLDSFVVYICLSGNGLIQHNNGTTRIGMGEVVLIPAELAQYTLIPEDHIELLETYISKP